MTQGTSIPLLLKVRVAVLSAPVLDPTVIGKLAMYLVLVLESKTADEDAPNVTQDWSTVCPKPANALPDAQKTLRSNEVDSLPTLLGEDSRGIRTTEVLLLVSAAITTSNSDSTSSNSLEALTVIGIDTLLFELLPGISNSTSMVVWFPVFPVEIIS